LTAQNGACFVEFNGNGASGSSYYQDMANRENAPNIWTTGHQKYGFVWVRAPAGAVSVTVALWQLNLGTNVSQVCNLPANSGWTACGNPEFVQNTADLYLRLQVYNNSTNNLDLDNAQVVVAP
jgi:hypothetical protein